MPKKRNRKRTPTSRSRKINAFSIERKRIADVTGADYNPRTISDEMLRFLQQSIQRWGLVEPIVWNRTTKTVVGGHERLKVLQTEGIEETNVVVVELSALEERALNLAFNRARADWHYPGLQSLLMELQTKAANLSASGFTTDEIAKLTDGRFMPNANLSPLLTSLGPQELIVCPYCGFKFTEGDHHEGENQRSED